MDPWEILVMWETSPLIGLVDFVLYNPMAEIEVREVDLAKIAMELQKEPEEGLLD